MNIIDMMEVKNVNNHMNNLNTTVSNTVDNDLLYILSILEKIDETVSKTFGPFSGYVASETVSSRTKISEMKYTKDGMTTLASMNFFIPTDLMIANEVTKLTAKIKQKSGDGSTTAVRLLYNLVKLAANSIRNENNKEIYSYRINTPKVIKMILDKVKANIEYNKTKSVTYEDIRNIGYISLNNDPELTKPIDELAEYMKKENISLDNSFQVLSTVSDIENTRLIKQPGYRLSVPHLCIDESVRDLEDVKLVFIHNVLDLKYQIPIQELHQFAQTNAFKNKKGERQKIIYVVSELDPSVTDLLRKYAKAAWADTQEVLYYDFMEMDTLRRFTKDKREDLCLLLNTQEVFLNDFIELRHAVYGDKYDNADNKSLWKMKMYTKEVDSGQKDEEGNPIMITERDHQTSRRDLFKTLSAALVNSYPVNITHIAGDDSLSISIDTTEEPSQLLKNHIVKLEKLAKDDDKEVAMEAANRLQNLNNKYYLIEIGAPVQADRERLNTAYRDATMAINSSVKYGYHMGGSIGVYFAVMRVEGELTEMLNKMESENRDPLNQELVSLRTAKFIITKIREAYTLLISNLLPNNMTTKEGFMSGYINPDTNKFGETTVISPVETDIETIRGALALFSSFFSSLALEFQDANSALHAKNISSNVKDLLDRREGKKEDPDGNAHEGNEEEELTEEEKAIKEQFKNAEKEFKDMTNNLLPVGMANNVRPVIDQWATRSDSTEKINKLIEKYGPKEVGNVTITGYGGDIRNIGSDIERERRRKEEAINRINILQQQFNSSTMIR